MARSERPTKRTKFFDESSDASEGESEALSKLAGGNEFTINEAYARRFEYNKKREEQQRLEEKYSATTGKRRTNGHGASFQDADREDEDDESSDESEDSDAELITENVDEEWGATLRAIKNKDPRVYDTSATFYTTFDPDGAQITAKQEKPLYLHDYHRQNLLSGDVPVEEVKSSTHAFAQPTYQDEQDQLKRDVVSSMHAAGEQQLGGSDEEFMIAKSRPKYDQRDRSVKAQVRTITEDDVKAADRDPETFLSNFMAAKAWLPTTGSRALNFDSDDSDEEQRADEFEEAYNMRFEDPQTANEKLQSFARDVGKYGVRRDEKSSRAKAREREKAQKEAGKRERDEEMARLRKLKIEEAEAKVKRIREAAGMRGQTIDINDWTHVIEGDFDDDRWEEEMQRRFGEEYYADVDADASLELGEDNVSQNRRAKKPKWEDDIDIGDLVPDFQEDGNPQISLTDDEDEASNSPPQKHSPKTRPTKKEVEREKSEAKRAARKERQRIEELVDSALPLHNPTLTSATASKAPVVGFRYRETSPTSFGMSARDILFADDAQLNQFAGLKKLHAFRDPERKQKDRQKLGKKQRLQKWRKETFGQSSAPTGGFEKILGSDEVKDASAGGPQSSDAAKKRKRKSKHRQSDA